jgi:hypothetical protein
MNGGVLHAVECMTGEELSDAEAGYPNSTSTLHADIPNSKASDYFTRIQRSPTTYRS